jgi:hypothetical protein
MTLVATAPGTDLINQLDGDATDCYHTDLLQGKLNLKT